MRLTAGAAVGARETTGAGGGGAAGLASGGRTAGADAGSGHGATNGEGVTVVITSSKAGGETGGRFCVAGFARADPTAFAAAPGSFGPGGPMPNVVARAARACAESRGAGAGSSTIRSEPVMCSGSSDSKRGSSMGGLAGLR